MFFPLLKTIFELISILLPFSASAIFVSPLQIGRMFPFEDLFHHFGGNKKVPQDESRWIGRVGHRGHAVFGPKLLNTQCSVGRRTHKSPIMKWANALKESSKKFTEAESASHNNASSYTDTDGFLEHSPSKESLYYKGSALQKIILGAPPHILVSGVANGTHPWKLSLLCPTLLLVRTAGPGLATSLCY